MTQIQLFTWVSSVLHHSLWHKFISTLHTSQPHPQYYYRVVKYTVVLVIFATHSPKAKRLFGNLHDCITEHNGFPIAVVWPQESQKKHEFLLHALRFCFLTCVAKITKTTVLHQIEKVLYMNSMSMMLVALESPFHAFSFQKITVANVIISPIMLLHAWADSVWSFNNTKG